MDAVLRYCNFDGVPGRDGTVCNWQLNAGVSIIVRKIDEISATPWFRQLGQALDVRALFELQSVEGSGPSSAAVNVTFLVRNRTDLALHCDGLVKLWNPMLQTLNEARFKGKVPQGPCSSKDVLGFSVSIRCPFAADSLSNDEPFCGNIYLIAGLYPEQSIGVHECRKPLSDPPLSREFADFDLIVLEESVDNAAEAASLVVERKIPAHRVVLAANSPVFAAMFNADMVEKRRESVVINGCSYEILSLFVNMLYSRKHFPENASYSHYLDLLQLADRYAVQDVKDACETRLTHLTSASNVCAVVELAYLVDCHKLKKVCWKILAPLRKRSIPGWADLKLKKPEFVIALLEDVDDLTHEEC